MQVFIGRILTFAGTFVPLRWLACDGSLVSIQDHDTPHENRMPYQVMSACIALAGVYPLSP